MSKVGLLAVPNINWTGLLAMAHPILKTGVSRPKAEDELNIFFDIIRQLGCDLSICYRLIHFTFVIYTTDVVHRDVLEIGSVQTLTLFRSDDNTLFLVTGDLQQYISLVTDLSIISGEHQQVANDIFKIFSKLKLSHVWKGFRVTENGGLLKWRKQ